ncbi:TPRXL protein [Cinnamomum micranthum f. kanehirae]|uniref:TPRXL protein n=1 Tax=Cinnamomum micranthum f. kanehirae TaxID=337451 RepID=A0A3S4PZV7_9MAGN|nr:TPRXL protein [Cinnamomum micranthum f. kanehirae]
MVLPPPRYSRPKSKVIYELTTPATAGRFIVCIVDEEIGLSGSSTYGDEMDFNNVNGREKYLSKWKLRSEIPVYLIEAKPQQIHLKSQAPLRRSYSTSRSHHLLLLSTERRMVNFNTSVGSSSRAVEDYSNSLDQRTPQSSPSSILFLLSLLILPHTCQHLRIRPFSPIRKILPRPLDLPSRSLSSGTHLIVKKLISGPPSQKRTCICLPTNHISSFRCSLHKNNFGAHLAVSAPIQSPPGAPIRDGELPCANRDRRRGIS